MHRLLTCSWWSAYLGWLFNTNYSPSNQPHCLSFYTLLSILRLGWCFHFLIFCINFLPDKQFYLVPSPTSGSSCQALSKLGTKTCLPCISWNSRPKWRVNYKLDTDTIRLTHYCLTIPVALFHLRKLILFYCALNYCSHLPTKKVSLHSGYHL